MTTPVFTLPTSGSDPKVATKEGLEENVNQIIEYLDDERIQGDSELNVKTQSIYDSEVFKVISGNSYLEKFDFLDLATQTATNLEDAGAISYNASHTEAGLQIGLNTARRTAFSTDNKVGTAKTKIKLKADTIFTGNCAVGFSMTDGVDRWFIDARSVNGYIVYNNSRGGGSILTQVAGTYDSGAIIEFEVVIDPVLETAQVRVSVDGRAPFTVGLDNIPCGDIELLQDENGTLVTWSMEIEAVSEYQKLETLSTTSLTDEQSGNMFAVEQFLAGYERTKPVGFEGRFDDYLKVYRQPASGNFLINFAPKALFTEEDPEVTRIYVDILTGDDEAGGTETAPLKGIITALKRVLENAKVKVYIKGGIYPYSNCWCSNGLPNGVKLEVVSWDGLPVVSSAHDDTLVWSLDDGTTWSAVFSDSVLNVFDASNLTTDGDFGTLTLAADITAVRTTANTYFVDGNTVYVNTFDGREPDSDIRVYRGGLNDIANGRFISQNGTLYMNNIHFEGGRYAFYSSLSSASTSSYIYGKSCSFKYSATGSSPLVNGNTVVIWEECTAAWNKGDGYHYNPIFDSNPADGVELNCIGRWNGVGFGNVGNNSSNHGGSTIRIKTKDGWGDYHHAESRGIHDIRDDENALSWCLGVTSRDSRNGYPNFAIGLTGETGISKMWLDNCVSSGTTIDIQANASAEAYTAGFVGGGTNIGSVTTYTP